MQTTRGNTMSVPNGQQREHACRKGARQRQVGTQHAVPVLHKTTGSQRLFPRLKEVTSDGAQS